MYVIYSVYLVLVFIKILVLFQKSYTNPFTTKLQEKVTKNNFIDYVKQLPVVVEYLMNTGNWKQIYSLRENKLTFAFLLKRRFFKR